MAGAKFALFPQPRGPSCAILPGAARDSRRCPRGFCLARAVRGARPATPDARSHAAVLLRVPATSPCHVHSDQQTLPRRRRREHCPPTACSRSFLDRVLQPLEVPAKISVTTPRPRSDSADHFQSDFGSSLAQGFQVETLKPGRREASRYSTRAWAGPLHAAQDFLPPFTFAGTVTGCARFRYHCCATPIKLPVIMYTASPLEKGMMKNIAANESGINFIIICCWGSVVVMGVIFVCRYIVPAIIT